MKNYIKILIGLLWFNTTLTAQTIITLNQPEAANGNVTHVANTSINFQPDYHYSPLTASSIHAYIDESVTGNTSPGGLMTGGIGGSFDGREINTGLAVGTISGNQGVSPSGAATYSIPIKLPLGTNGLIPELSINYNSQTGNGLLGYGWNLGGISKIYRTQKTIYHDTKIDPVYFNVNDVFSLDGNRLISISGTYGADGSIYGIEKEIFNKITSYGMSGNGPSWFKIETKDGLIIEIGNTNDSKHIPASQSSVSAWYINKVSDNYGNYCTYSYRVENDELVIDKIEYTGNSNLSTEPYYSIQFIYNERQDKNILFISNEAIKSNVVLSNIKIRSEGNLVREYEFKYGYSTYSYLTEIIEYGANNSSLNSTIFKYGEPTDDVVEEATSGIISTSLHAEYWSGDYNGDGKTDLMALNWDIVVGPNSNKYWIDWDLYINQGNNQYLKVLANQSFPTGFEPHRPAYVSNPDFNGDGKEDIIFTTITTDTYHTFTFHPYLSVGDGNSISFQPQPTFQDAAPLNKSFVLQYVDFDGDGKLEIFIFSEGLGIGDGVNIIFNANKNDPNSYYDIISNYTFDESFVVDMDGDGKSEIANIYNVQDNKFYKLWFDKTGTGGGSYNGTMIFTEQPTILNNPSSFKKTLFGDYNGDGKTDVISTSTWQYPSWQGWSLNYGMGAQFDLSTVDILLQNPILTMSNDNKEVFHFVVDVNGDGKSDVIEIENSRDNQWTPIVTTIYIFYSNGKSFIKKSYPLNLQIYVTDDDIEFGDFNGDGLLDIFTNNFSSSQIPQIIYFEKETKERLLHGIKDGFNNTTEFTYDYLTNNTIYTKGNSSSYPFVDVQIPIAVVASVKTDNGIGGDNITTYKYEEAILHKQGRGLLGFKKTISENNTSNTRTITEYGIDNTFITPYLKKINTALISPSQPLSETEYFYDYSNLGNKRFLNTISQIVQKNLLNNFITTTNYSVYDNFGNVELTTINKGGIETITINDLYESHGNWGINNRLASSVTTVNRTGSPAYVRETSFGYNTKGSLESKTDDNGVTTTIRYNDFGNIDKTTVAGSSVRINEFIYDAKGRFIVETINPLGQHSYATYDNRWGVPLTQTGVDLLTTTYQYDGFGRLIKTTTPDNISTETTLAWEIGGGGATNPISADNSIYTSTTTTTQSPTTKVWYDSFGRPRKNSVDGFDNIINQVTTYDARGNVATTTTPFFAADSPKITTYTYDDYNLNNSITNDVSTTTIIRTLSTGTTTTTLTPSNSIGNPTTSTTVTDPTGKTISVTDAGGTLTYTYYSSGLQKDIKLDGVEVAYMEYNLLGKQTLLRDQNAGVTTYEYNSFGELTKQTDAAIPANIYVMTYDVMGRIETKTENGNPNFTTNYEYYGTGDNGVNQVKNITYNGITQHFTYDYLGRLTENKETIGADEYKFGYQYDTYNRLEQTTYPSGFITKHTYNSLSYPTSVTDEQANPIWQVGSTNVMNAYNQYKSYILGNGQTTTKTYDDYGLLTSISASNPDIQNLVLNFNPANGNLMSRERLTTGTRIGVLEEFTYDDLNRLIETKVNSVTQQTMQYQTNGNIGFKTDAGNYSYHVNKKNAVVQVSNSVGDISSNVQDITYTPFNSVGTIIENPPVVGQAKQLTFTYAADQQRRKMEYLNNNILQKTNYYIGNYEKIVNETNGDVTELHYIAGGDGLAAIHVITTPITQPSTPSTFYTYTDHLGSILTLTDEDANLVYEQNFDAWGRERNPDTWDYSANSGTKPEWLTRGYTGHEHLAEFGLINMNGRLYDPILARMLSPDNYIQDATSTQGYNRYSYVVNNPLKYTDPSGEFIPFLAAMFIGAVVGIFIGNELANSVNAQGLDRALYVIGGAIIGGFAGYLGAGIAAAGGAFANTSAIAAGSFFNSIGFTALSGGRTNISISFGAVSYNLDKDDWGYLGEKGNSFGQNFGYGLGAFANISDIYGFSKGAYGDNVESVELQSDNHSSIYDKDGNSLLDVGAKKPRSTITTKEGISGDLELTMDYRNHQASIGENIKPSIWNRRQTINNVRIDKIVSYRNALSTSGKGYGLFRVFGGCNINCSGGASMALLNAGVFNIPIAVPGILSAQMYIRQYSYFSYYFK